MYHNDTQKETMLQDGASGRANAAAKRPCAAVSLGDCSATAPLDMTRLSNRIELNNKQGVQRAGNCPCKKLLAMKLSPKFYVFTYEARAKLYVAEEHHDC
jgi:hypothetical protein